MTVDVSETTEAVAAKKALMLMTEALDLIDAYGLSKDSGYHIELARQDLAHRFAEYLGGEDTLMNVRMAMLTRKSS